MQYNRPMETNESISLFGWQWLAARKGVVVQQLVARLQKSDGDVLAIATGNPEQVMLAQRDRQFYQTVKDEFDWLLPDGEGIVWASQRTNSGQTIPERVAGVEVVAEVLAQLPSDFGPVLVIGGRGYQGKTVKTASGQWKIIAFGREETQSKEQLVVWLPAYTDASRPNKEEEEEVALVFRMLQPKLVFVALGAPQQEFWVAQHKSLFRKSGVRVVMVVGGAFDMLTGIIPRAPLLVRQLKLEWFWRLLQEPSRWRRQLALVRFLWLVLNKSK